MVVLRRALCLILSLSFLSSVASSRFNFPHDGWTLSEDLKPTEVVAQVPGTPYTALYSAGMIGDPFYRDNDLQLEWIGLTNWTYSLTFDVPSKVVSAGRSVLVCEGLDTVATVHLNNNLLGHTDNMFLRYTFDVTGLLKQTNNSIQVSFTSAVLEAARRAEIPGYMIPPECPQPAQKGVCHVNQLRKEQCSFSWDWGPSFPTQGIWQPIFIDSHGSAIIRDVTALVNLDVETKSLEQWEVTVEVYLDVTKGTSVTGQLDVGISELQANVSKTVTVSDTNNKVTVKLTLKSNKPIPRWWPTGLGEQKLYKLDVRFVANDETSEKSLKIGLKTVELVQDEVRLNYTEWGRSFYFKVNGIPVFLKGSNWIPADSFKERVTRERLRYLLSSAADAGINSMRVWGGGVYESEDFYELCDELGILLWHDFMFSVAFYPAYPEFLDSVTQEVTYQVRRLKHHASILLWAGNNENEKALRQDWFHIKDNYTRYYNDYVKLYATTIMAVLDQEDPHRPYLTSSPTDGLLSVQQGYVAKDPGSELYGDIHYYDYLQDQWKADVFRSPRMASEYGIQAWCNVETLSGVFKKEDFNISSYNALRRQHHPKGEAELDTEVKMHFKVPDPTDAEFYFKEYIYLTQINQAMSIRSQSEHYRRESSRLKDDGKGLTQGALYWQLNDIWQGPTWSSIDYSGRWKMLHYYAKKFFSPLLISPYLDDDDKYLSVNIVLDLATKFERNSTTGELEQHHLTSVDPGSHLAPLVKRSNGLRSGSLKFRMFSYGSFQPLHVWSVHYDLAQSSEQVFRQPIADLISQSKCKGREHCFLTFTAADDAGNIVADNWLALTYPKDAKIKVPELKINSLSHVDASHYKLTVSSNAVAMFVWVSAGDIPGHFSDNGFLQTQAEVDLTFTSVKPTSVEELWAQLSVRSVINYKPKGGGNAGASLKMEILNFVLIWLSIFSVFHLLKN